MKYPQLRAMEASRQTVDIFKGYNHNLRIGEGEFFDMKNMTSDYYPVLSPRGKRGVYASPTAPNGLIAKDALCYVDGSAFVINEYRVDMELSDTPKQLVSMGAYVVIWPDKKYINTADLSDYGDLEAEKETNDDVSFKLCKVDGTEYGEIPVSNVEPADPTNGDLWIDSSTENHVLKQYSSSSSLRWIQIATTYVRIEYPGIGKLFNQYDGISLSGITVAAHLNGTAVIQDKGDDYIVIIGLLDKAVTQKAEDGKITIARRVPEMDFITECGNRLWGCRYGLSADEKVVNEIYACKLGDIKNWNCFMGLATDSYAASCGTDGKFTGAITHLGYPLFFKENCVHKVYGNYPANFQIQTTACRGVQDGCDRSLAIVNETLFYKSRSAVCAYDGSLPAEVSYALGNDVYGEAVGGSHGNKYYISMRDLNGEYHLFVYDIAKGMWHKEDDLHVDFFCSCRGEMYAVSEGKIITMLGSGTKDTEMVAWRAETGEIGISSPDMKYTSRINIRMAMEIGAEIRIYAQYDFSDEWELVWVLRCTNLRSFSIPIRPKRCDFMRLRLEGEGDVKVYSITKTVEQGSDVR